MSTDGAAATDEPPPPPDEPDDPDTPDDPDDPEPEPEPDEVPLSDGADEPEDGAALGPGALAGPFSPSWDALASAGIRPGLRWVLLVLVRAVVVARPCAVARLGVIEATTAEVAAVPAAVATMSHRRRRLMRTKVRSRRWAAAARDVRAGFVMDMTAISPRSRQLLVRER